MGLLCCAAFGLLFCYLMDTNRRFPLNYKCHAKKHKEEKPLNIFSGFLRDFRLVWGLNREGRAASACGFGIGVADNKLRTLQAFGVVDLRTDEVLIAHRINQKFQAGFFDFKVVVIFDFIESKPYWKPEQPPPFTKTRNFSSGLFSSAIKSATLAQQLSVKTIGLSSDMV